MATQPSPDQSGAPFPTRRDEAWRYSDMDALATLDVGRFDDWRDIDVAAGESFTECLVLDGEGAAELRRFRIHIGDGGTCAMFAVNAAAQLGRIEMVVQLGDGAHFEFGGVTLGGGDTTREFVTRVAHEKPNATSNQVVRAVHWDKGTGNFLGRIDVVRDAQKTDAAQSFKGLLMNKGASANAVPQLEIYADDVKCAHGAAVGQLDEMARYYMAARGITPETAKKLLVRAFLADAFVALDDEAERDRMLETALTALEEAKL
ncbi:Protein ABCI7, chloroplastic [Alteripontixanthobacter maritimus]|uniref:Protein ABCI7, chloroplastic n=1 Tax=Alteripontixanthobacter maritimus TaxID=2161824 RepID=A0A369QD91_9SPHN|nr:SufD family Fe-S cluster assembly protein [Alteripontixanthobacter maritimus]RDC61196.1 Protein ABCI7, chloroplastic [Alteripontixanthobacter maritimus]